MCGKRLESSKFLNNSITREMTHFYSYEHVAGGRGFHRIHFQPSHRFRVEAPRLGKHMRIAWLRYWRRMQVSGQTKAAWISKHLRQVAEFSTGKLFPAFATALLKPIGVLIIIYLLIRFGMPELAGLLLPKG